MKSNGKKHLISDHSEQEMHTPCWCFSNYLLLWNPFGDEIFHRTLKQTLNTCSFIKTLHAKSSD